MSAYQTSKGRQHWACELEQIEVVKLLVGRNEIRLKPQNIKWACRSGQLDVLKRMLDLQ